MQVQYQIVFSIEVLNTYFGNGAWKEVKFIPLPETQQLLRSNGYQLRQVKNQLLVITPVDLVTKVPLKLPVLSDKFSFILEIQSPGYINFTNIPVPESGMNCFSFHNRTGNVVGGTNYITAGIRPYQNTIPYKPGDFAKGADSKTYEAIKLNTGLQAPDDSVPASKDFWVLRNDFQFVTHEDCLVREGNTSFALEVAGAFINFQTAAPSTTHKVFVYAYNLATNNFDKQVRAETLTSDSPSNFVPIDLRSLTSAVYKIQVNNEVRYVYHSTASAGSIPMFLDIYHLPKNHPNSFLKADNTLKNIKYTLQFSGRRVFWRYKTRTNAIDKILDSSGEFTFKADGSRFFISERPMPLSDVPRKSLSANTGALVITSPLPNPRTDRLREKRDEIFTTESFINY